MRNRAFALCLIASVALLPSMPAAAQSYATDTMLPKSDALKPGQFVWYPHYEQASTGGQVKIIVSLPQQRAFIYQGGQLIAISTVSTGSEGRETPTGEFTILQKNRFHRSNLYSNAPMPFMQRLTWDGIALHAGHLPGYPASHGCIRLPAAFAKQLFAITAMGGQVSVVDD
ncbi:MAG: L,D-transpeptidase, partial [Sphingomonadales bacterium]